MQNYNIGEIKPRVTVVIPTRNRSEDLLKAIKSVVQLDYPLFDLIIVDQSDNDTTRKIIQPFLNNPHFCYLPSYTKGAAAARNEGAAAATTEFVVFTDDDCEVPTDWLTEMVAALQLDERIGIVFGSVIPGPYDEKAGFVPSYYCNQPFLAHGIKDKNQVRGVGACFGIRRSVW